MNKSRRPRAYTKLRELINDYRYHYHVLDESIMSEAAADSLKHELSQLEAEYPELITPDSPTPAGGWRAAARRFTPVEHSSRMLSLNDVFDEAEAQAWEERIIKLLPAGAGWNISPTSKWTAWPAPWFIKTAYWPAALPAVTVLSAKTSRPICGRLIRCR
jgi:NAD-dependent DNA ligase